MKSKTSFLKSVRLPRLSTVQTNFVHFHHFPASCRVALRFVHLISLFVTAYPFSYAKEKDQNFFKDVD